MVRYRSLPSSMGSCTRTAQPTSMLVLSNICNGDQALGHGINVGHLTLAPEGDFFESIQMACINVENSLELALLFRNIFDTSKYGILQLNNGLALTPQMGVN